VRLDRRGIALLLIDFQEEQRQHPDWSVAGFETVIANAGRLLSAARERGIAVFHAAYHRNFTISPPRPFEPMAKDGSPAFSATTSAGTAICKEVEPIASEQVIRKNDASAFCEGNLASLLASRAVEWLIVAGVWSEACVAATIKDAQAAGLRVLLVKDACGSGTEAMHQTAVLNIANRLYGGGVANTGRAVSLIAGEAAQVWMPERPVPILFNYSDAARHYDLL
jgi:nicotinamidase-related amidase